MNPILQALRAGKSAEKILKFFSSGDANLASRINAAIAAGYSAEKILNYVMQGGKKLSNVLPEPNKNDVNLYKSMQSVSPEFKKAAGLAIGAASLGLGYAGLRGLGGIGSQAVMGELMPAEEQMLQIGQQQPRLQIEQQIQAGQPKPQQPPQPQPPSVLPSEEVQNLAKPDVQKVSIFDQLLKGVDITTLHPGRQRELGFYKTIAEKMQADGKTLQDPQFKALAKKIKNVVKKPKTLLETEIERFQEGYSTKPEETMQIAKGSQVITPTGDIAEVEEAPGKTVKINVDGKKSIVQKDDLIQIPENSEEIEDLYKKLIDKIPEGYKSRMADYIGYDEKNNALQVIFHDGNSYIYDDVPEEIVKEIVNSEFIAKTSFGNYIGKWYKGEPSIGAGLARLLADLQDSRGGKGKEYSGKFKELYSLHRYPKQKLKEKTEREKKEEKRRKKTT
jgi:KTSC domain-containing protein